jgi:DNA-binding NtrC family response regulator/tetratricopeptide (TPR) repeat protein
VVEAWWWWWWHWLACHGSKIGAVDPQVELLGTSRGIKAVRETIERLLPRQAGARRLAPVLLQGETGTGKGLLARLIHREGPRRAGPFVDVNCAAIPENLLEAEMFGYERGAFTDARQAKPGLFQVAHGGTIFLDEVGLLPEGLQAKLLKVIEERAVRRLGGTRSEPVDAWIVTATNEDLTRATRLGRFREDLYHRLAVVTLALPPLRERGEDVLLLAEHFLARACADYGLSQKAFTPDARETLLAYPWPGNVRELSNVVERVALLSDGPLVTAETLGLPAVAPAPPQAPAPTSRGASAATPAPGDERERLLAALRETDWNVSRAASRLGISRNTIRYRIEKYRLRRDVEEPPELPTPAAPETRRPAADRREVAAPPVVRWERRRVTFLRAAVVVAEPGAFHPDLARAFEVLVDKPRSFGGQIEELGRAAIVAAFGLDPSEDAPRRAANAALAIVKGVERARRAEGGSDWTLTLVVHVAEVVVGRVEGSAQIDHEAKRDLWRVLDDLVDRAGPDTIVASEAAAPFLERHFDLVPVAPPAAGLFRLTGHERIGLGPAGRMAQFVGRRRELELLWSRFEAAARGQGQVVGISGEAGIGKSRFLFEFQRSLGDRPVTYLEAHCLSYASSIPYLPVLELLRGAADITESDPAEIVAAKVRAHVADAGMAQEDAVPYLLYLLGIREGAERLANEDPETVKARIFDILRRITLHRSRSQPLVLVVEDLHWIDRTSAEYLATLVDGMAGAPLFVITTYRPGYRPPWMGRSYATQISLPALEPDDGLSLVRFVLGSDRVPDPLARQIIAKGEGNPFFIEELARTIREQGWESASSLAVPDTVQEVLRARIDRLPAEDKRLLEVASVLGKNVPLGLLRAIADLPDEPLRRGLDRLQSAEFLFETGLYVDLEYSFKHALTHEVTYGRLLPDRRRDLHARIVDAIETLHGDRLGGEVERLAHHALQGELREKAVRYLRQAGVKAAAWSALHDAQLRFEEALGVLATLPESRSTLEQGFEIRIELRSVLVLLGEVRHMLARLREAEALAGRLNDPHRQGRVAAFVAFAHSQLGELDEALASGNHALALGQALGDPWLRILSTTLLGPVHYLRGEYARAVELTTDGLAALPVDATYESIGLATPPAILNRYHLIVCLVQLGRFAEAAEHEAETIRIAEPTHHGYSLGQAYFAAGWIHLGKGEWEAARTLLERAVEAYRMGHAAVHLAIALATSAWPLAQLGEAGEAPDRLREAEQLLERLAAGGVVYHRGWDYHALGRASLLLGRRDEAQRLATCALEFSPRHPGFAAHALHLLGDIASHPDRFDAGRGEAHYRQALSLAEPRSMRPLVAHCHLGLGALYRRAGKQREAQEHLTLATTMYRAMDVRFWLERAERAATASA